MTFAAFGFLFLVHSQYMIDKTKAVEDKILLGYAFRTLTMKTVDECFYHCYEDCFCMAFQMCQSTECQLLSTNQFQSPSALVTVKGCSYYDMLPDFEQIKKKRSCDPDPAYGCQIFTNLCPVGKRYVAITPKAYTTPRYLCYPLKSCRSYANGSRVPGKYQVFDDNLNAYEVFCDFDSTTNMTWTLVQSYQFQYKSKFNIVYSSNKPVNEDTPRWDEYRLSKSRMQSIQDDSNEFRVTCKYDTDGVAYTDYLQVTKKEIDLLIFAKGLCRFVEYIDIRGQHCSKCTAYIHQSPNVLHFHADSTCEFQPKKSSGCGDIGFGWYGCYNSENRCMSSPTATTQTWLGAN